MGRHYIKLNGYLKLQEKEIICVKILKGFTGNKRGTIVKNLGRNWVKLRSLSTAGLPSAFTLHKSDHVTPSSEASGVEASTVADKTLGTLFLPFPHL